MMNPSQSNSWDRLQAYDLPATNSALSFVARLARDNNWSVERAERAIQEYRRFCFLSIHAGHPVTPSDAIDQVWHLHMLFSEDYWQRFCHHVLGQQLHHGPTQGGGAEASKYRDWYQRTMDSYRRFFGPPPEELWPSVAARFRSAGRFVRVNRSEVLMLDRGRLRQRLRWLIGGALVVATGSAAATGSEVLTALGVMALMGIVFVLFGAIIAVSRSANSDKKGAGCGGGVGGGGNSGGKADANGSGDSGGGDAGCGGCGGCGG